MSNYLPMIIFVAAVFILLFVAFPKKRKDCASDCRECDSDQEDIHEKFIDESVTIELSEPGGFHHVLKDKIDKLLEGLTYFNEGTLNLTCESENSMDITNSDDKALYALASINPRFYPSQIEYANAAGSLSEIGFRLDENNSSEEGSIQAYSKNYSLNEKSSLLTELSMAILLLNRPTADKPVHVSIEFDELKSELIDAS